MIEIKRLSESPKLARSLELSRGGKKLVTPTYFPAISGTQHNFKIGNLLEVVAGISYPRVLISAYDFVGNADPVTRANLRQLKGYYNKDSWLMLDSGIFESSRLEDEEWSFDQYSKVIRDIQSDIYFAFDKYPQGKVTNPEFAAATKDGINRSCNIGAASECVSVIHGFTPSQLLHVAKSLMRTSSSQMKLVAVPERDCGSTLTQRAETVLKLRQMLDSHGEMLLHLLGCGNPVSMATYVYCGADSFDSLDWTEQFVDRTSFAFRELSHYDIIDCTCDVCTRMIRGPKLGKALLHNLLFYFKFSVQLQEMVRKNTLRDFLLEFMKGSIIDSIGK